MTKRTVTSIAHGITAGSIIRGYDATTYCSRLWRALSRPRITYVSRADANTIDIEDRRATWAEWRWMVWLALKGRR